MKRLNRVGLFFFCRSLRESPTAGLERAAVSFKQNTNTGISCKWPWYPTA